MASRRPVSGCPMPRISLITSAAWSTPTMPAAPEHPRLGAGGRLFRAAAARVAAAVARRGKGHDGGDLTLEAEDPPSTSGLRSKMATSLAR